MHTVAFHTKRHEKLDLVAELNLQTKLSGNLNKNYIDRLNTVF